MTVRHAIIKSIFDKRGLYNSSKANYRFRMAKMFRFIPVVHGRAVNEEVLLVYVAQYTSYMLLYKIKL